MPGKTRVSALAKELGLPSKTLIEWLNQNGEYVKTASSTIEAPAAPDTPGICLQATCPFQSRAPPQA